MESLSARVYMNSNLIYNQQNIERSQVQLRTNGEGKKIDRKKERKKKHIEKKISSIGILDETLDERE